MELILWALPLLARALIGGYFVLSGIQHFKHKTYILDKFKVHPLPMGRSLFYSANLLQIMGGSMVLFGIYMFIGALFLIPINIFAAFILHPFWMEEGELRWIQRLCFSLRLMVVTGALLLLIEPILLNSLFIILRH